MIDTQAIRKRIWELAVNGLLTKQFPSNESAEDLYKKIQLMKQHDNDSGVFKGKKKIVIEPIIPSSQLHRIPNNWKWVRLGEVCEIFGRIGFRGYKKSDIVEKGKGAITLSPSNILDNGTITYEKCTYLSWEKYDESPEIQIIDGDVLIVKTASIGRCCVVKNLPEKATINPQIAVLKYIYCDNEYLNIVLNSPDSQKQFHNFAIGTAVPTFSQVKLANLIMPLPPIEEQKRIVRVVSDINAILETIESLQCRYTYNISALDKKILDLAVQGKLVPQDPSDEPASVLLKKIAAEKQKLIQEGKIKKQKKLPAITEDEIPFEIPKTWEWVRLGNVVDLLSGYAFKSQNFLNNGHYRLLRGINLSVENIRWDDTVYLDTIPKKLQVYKIAQGDVLLGLDRPWISDGIRVDIFNGPEDTLLVQRVLRIRDIGVMINRYIAILLRSQLFKDAVANDTTGISVPHISQSQVSNVVVPLPPLREQVRIANCIDELIPAIRQIRE